MGVLSRGSTGAGRVAGRCGALTGTTPGTLDGAALGASPKTGDNSESDTADEISQGRMIPSPLNSAVEIETDRLHKCIKTIRTSNFLSQRLYSRLRPELTEEFAYVRYVIWRH